MDGPEAPALHTLLAHTRWVEQLARSLVRDPSVAADLAQATLLAALETPDAVERPRPWLARVLRNQAREWFRRERARPQVEQRGSREERLPGPDELALRADCERRVVAAVLALEDPHRTTLLLRYFEGLTPTEIARRSGESLATVTSRITRAHGRLRASLADDGRADPRTAGLWVLAPILHRDPGTSFPSGELPRTTAPPPSAAAGATSTGLVTWIMGTTTKTLLCLAGLAAALWLLWPSQEPPPANSVVAVAPAGPATPPPSKEPAAEAATLDGRVPLAAPVAAPSAVGAVPPAPEMGRIRGQVFRPDGRPAAGRRVRMLRSSKGPEKFATADAEGRFDDRELPPGAWSLSTWPDEAELAALGKADQNTLGGFAFLAQRTVDLAPGDDVEVLLGAPSPTAVAVRGRILLGEESVEGYLTWMPDGKDSMDRQRVAAASPETGYATEVDAPGRYLVLVVHGEARVEFALEVPAGPEFQRDFPLPETTLEGRVKGADGLPVKGAKVALTPRAGVLPRHPASNISFSRTSGEDGAFAFRNLPAGRYGVAVHGGVLGSANGPASAQARGEFTLEPGVPPEPLELFVEAGREVQGRVQSPPELSPTSGVFVFDSAGEPLNPLQPVSTGKDGTFKLFPLAPGAYSAVAAHGGWWSAPLRFQVPSAGEADALELTLVEAATLTVELTGRQGAWIDLRDAAGSCFSALLDRHAFDRSITRDWSTTRFVFHVPPGEYRALARGSPAGDAEQRVLLRSGERVTADLSGR